MLRETCVCLQPMRPGREMTSHYVSGSGGLDAVSRKSTSGHIALNLCSTSGGICGSCSAFWCVRAVKRQRTIFQARVGPVRFLEKARRDSLRRTHVFVFGGICGTHSAFRCVWGAKHRTTIFHAQVGLVHFP
jgi:hypothetical protein